MNHRPGLVGGRIREVEKRTLPRFPFSRMTFKAAGTRAFAVGDINDRGMRLQLRDGGHGHREGEVLEGVVKWRGETVELRGTVLWVRGDSLGLAFDEEGAVRVRGLLGLGNVVAGLRPIRREDFDLEFPAGLGHWLRADRIAEVLVWQRPGGEVSSFQILLYGLLVEYEDGQGLKTGRVLERRGLDTPLAQRDELVLQVDPELDPGKLRLARDLAGRLGEGHLPQAVRDFLAVRLGAAPRSGEKAG